MENQQPVAERCCTMVEEMSVVKGLSRLPCPLATRTFQTCCHIVLGAQSSRSMTRHHEQVGARLKRRGTSRGGNFINSSSQ